MPEQSEIPSIPIQRTRDSLVVSIQIDVDDAILDRLRDDLLERIRVSHARGVVIDLAGVVVLDAHEFEKLRQMLVMANVMGARPVLSGLRPGVVSALVELGIDAGDIETAIDVEAALAVLEPAQPADEGLERAAADEDPEGADASVAEAGELEGSGV